MSDSGQAVVSSSQMEVGSGQVDLIQVGRGCVQVRWWCGQLKWGYVEVRWGCGQLKWGYVQVRWSNETIWVTWAHGHTHCLRQAV